MAGFDDCYATDADLAAVCVADYPAIVPAAQWVAGGADGAFAPEAFDLTSAEDFTARGVVADMVVLLESGADLPDDLLVVAAAESGSLRLRRRGLAVGQGRPPSLFGSAAVEYAVLTCLPQLAAATAWLRTRFQVPGADPADFRRACILRALVDLYDAAQKAAKDPDNFARKRAQYQAELDAALADLAARYPVPPSPLSPAGSPVGANAIMVDDPAWRLPRGY